MYCTACGAKNDDDMKFCVNCGKELNADSTDLFDAPTSTKAQSEAAAPPPKKLSKKAKVAMIVIAAVLVLGFSAYKTVSWFMSPEYAVSQYVKAQSEGNYSALYDMLDMPDGEFTKKEQFVEIHEKSSSKDKKGTISNITITEADSEDYSVFARCYSDVDFNIAYRVDYIAQKGEKEHTTVLLTSEDWLFFKNYKVAPAEYVTRKYEVCVPSYAKATFDGVELGDKYIDAEASNNGNQYSLENVLLGEHTVTVTGPLIDTAEIKLNITGSDSFDCSGKLKIKQSIKDEMQKTAEDSVKVIIEGIDKKKEFSEIESQLKIASGQSNQVKKWYDDFSETDWSNYWSQNVKYDKIELSNTEPASENAFKISESSKSQLTYGITFDVACDYTYVFFGDLENKSHNDSTYTVGVEYVYENDEIKIYNINNNYYDSDY